MNSSIERDDFLKAVDGLYSSYTINVMDDNKREIIALYDAKCEELNALKREQVKWINESDDLGELIDKETEALKG